MIRGLVFDFDGVILDTETAEFEAWSEVFAELGAALAHDDWVHCVGTTQSVDMYALLQQRADTALPSRDQVHARQRRRALSLAEAAPILPGVLDWVDEAVSRGLRLAIASNSPESWPHAHLERIGLRARFTHLSCWDGVCAGKPDPYLYAAACEAIGVEPHEAIAVEDSADGVRAAKGAGLFCVAVPRGLTAGVDLSTADVVVDSLAALPLGTVVERAEAVPSAQRRRPRDQGHR